MSRLEQLVSLRDRVNAEIARERAYRRRIDKLSGEVSRYITEPSIVGHSVLVDVCTVFHVGADQVCSDSRANDAVHARQVASWLLRARGMSLPQIGRIIGRDHTTALYGINRVDADPMLRQIAGRLLDELGGAA